MRDVLFTLAAAVIGFAVVLGMLRFIEMCAEHELRMADQRSRNREAEGLGGSVEGLDVHEVQNG